MLELPVPEEEKRSRPGLGRLLLPHTPIRTRVLYTLYTVASLAATCLVQILAVCLDYKGTEPWLQWWLKLSPRPLNIVA